MRLSKSPVPSDHNAFTFTVFFLYSEFDDKDDGGYNFWKGDYESIEAELSRISWRTLFSRCDSVETMYKCFLDCIHTVNEFIPKRNGKCRNTKLKEYIGLLKDLLRNDPNPNYECKLRKASTRPRILEESNLDF